MSADDDLDELYGLPPEEFTARRKELVATARKRGDADAAKLIGAARRPTIAAWVVNLLVRRDDTARRRLSDLSDELRTAHAAMDGSRIRESTAAQRKLIDALARAGFAAAGQAEPSAALRDDVTGTLQAAVADPDVAARLGRLTAAERWSGFGDFGTTSVVAGTSRRAAPTQEQSEPPTEPELTAARERRDATAVELAAAEAARADADEVVADREGQLATARRRYEQLLETLNAAERAVNTADVELDSARKSAGANAGRVQDAASGLAAAEAALAALSDE